MTPVVPADVFWDGKDGKSRKEAVGRVKGSWKDFSVLRAEALGKDGVRPVRSDAPSRIPRTSSQVRDVLFATFY
jgi:hypothetical protein